MLLGRKLPRSSFVLLTLSGACAVAAAGVMHAYAARLDELRPDGGTLVRLVVATGDRSRGSELTEDDVEMTAIPSRYAPPGALRDIARVVGRTLAADVAEGEVLTGLRLAGGSSGPTASLVPAGLRAVQVPVAATVGVREGDHVDVIATFGDGGAHSELAGEGLEVLGVVRGGAGPGRAPRVRLDVRDPLDRGAGPGRAPSGGAHRVGHDRRLAWAVRRRKDRVSILQAIVLGLVQGTTEFAPVSSSGHLILVPWILGWALLGDPDLNKAFDVALHAGTLVGALIYFRAEVVRYLRAWFRSIGARRIGTPDERIAWALVVGTIPGILVGATFETLIQDELGAPWLIAAMLVAFGLLLVVVDRRARVDRPYDSIGPKDGLLLGTAQALALQPGVSRSGVTITAARAMGLDRESAARFSFLLSLPIIAGAAAYKAVDLARTGLQGEATAFAAGILASAVSGFLVIWGLLRYLRRHDFTAFLWYRIALAALVAVLIVTGVRDPAP